MSDFNRPFYTIPQAAAVLQVHENTLYNMVRRKELDHYKIGRQIRIAAAELEKLKVPAENQPKNRANKD